MTEETINEDELFITSIDAEGNITKMPVVWHAFRAYVIIKSYSSRQWITNVRSPPDAASKIGLLLFPYLGGFCFVFDTLQNNLLYYDYLKGV